MKRKLLPIAILCLCGLMACGNTGGQNSTPTSSINLDDYTGCTVSINNKEELQAKWYAGQTRTLDMTFSPNCNVASYLKQGIIRITSSNEAAVKVVGQRLTAVGAGLSTITVDYGKDGKDSVEVSITDDSGIWSTTLENVMTADEAYNEAIADGFNTKTVKVIGKITSITNTSTGAGYMTSRTGDSFIQIYNGLCGKNGIASYAQIQDEYRPVADDVVVIEASLTNYKGTIEFNSLGKVLQVNGTLVPDAPATGVTVDKADLSIPMGDSASIKAYPAPIYAAGTPTFSSEDETIASVDKDGKITANSLGTTKIISKIDTFTAETVVTVTKPDAIISEVTTPVDGESYVIGCNQVNKGAKYYWDGTIVNSSGNRLNLGKTDFDTATKITYKKVSDTTFTLHKGDEYLCLDGDKYIVLGEEKDAITFTLKKDQNSFTYQGADSKTYFLGTYNNYTTLAGCEATDSNWKNDFAAHLYSKMEVCDPADMTLSATTASVHVDDPTGLKLSATLAPSNALGLVTWTSSNTSVATVDVHGLVTPVAVGSTTITATVKGEGNVDITKECAVTVVAAENYGTEENPLTISQAKTIISAFIDKSYSYKPMVVKGVVSYSTYSSQYNNHVAWMTSDTNTLGKDIELYNCVIPGEYAAENSLRGHELTVEGYAQRYGSTYEFVNKYNNFSFNVLQDTANTGTATAVAINGAASVDLTVGQEVALDAYVKPITAEAEFTWQSSNTSVVTVENGKLEGKAQGDAVVTVSVAVGEGETLKAQVNVAVWGEPKAKFGIDALTPLKDISKTSYNHAGEFEVGDVTFSINEGICWNEYVGSKDNTQKLKYIQVRKDANDNSKPNGIIKNIDPLTGVTKIRIVWLATYASEDTKYFPGVKAGETADSVSVVAANQTAALSGEKLNWQTTDASPKTAYQYVCTYTLPANSSYIQIYGTTAGACNILEIGLY